MTLPATAQQLLTDFSSVTNWEQKMRLLMQLGATLEPLATQELVETNKVMGCESQVWLVATEQADHWHIRAYSEARLIRGLLVVLLARVNHSTATEIAQLDLTEWFNQLGLTKQLSSSRRDGLNAIWQKIKAISRP